MNADIKYAQNKEGKKNLAKKNLYIVFRQVLPSSNGNMLKVFRIDMSEREFFGNL